MANNFPPMTPLKFWTQKILPLIYDDSLSYLEMLGKVKSKLNELIEYYNGLKDVIPKEAEELYTNIAERLEVDLQAAIRSLNDALTADILDLNDAKQGALGDIESAVTAAEGTIDTYALEKVQQIIADYDSALAPLLTPSATATELSPGSAPTASYSNGVFTFGLPGNQGDMTVSEYGGSAPGVVAEADNAASLGDSPAADYMQKSVYDSNDDGVVDEAETAADADALGGHLSDEYMLKEDYTGTGTLAVSKANDSNRLNGQPSSYYATAAQMSQAQNDIQNLQEQIGTSDIVQLKQQIGNFRMIYKSCPANQAITFTFTSQFFGRLLIDGQYGPQFGFEMGIYAATNGTLKNPNEGGSADGLVWQKNGNVLTITYTIPLFSYTILRSLAWRLARLALGRFAPSVKRPDLLMTFGALGLDLSSGPLDLRLPWP